MSTAAALPELTQICREQAHSIGPALGRAWDRSVRCSVAEGPAPSLSEALLELGRPGLVAAWMHEGQAGLLLVPAGPVLPSTYRTPTPEQHARSHAATATVGKLFLPRGIDPETRIAVLDDLTEVAARFGESAPLAKLALSSGPQATAAWLAWPVAAELVPMAELAAQAGNRIAAGDFDAALKQLPPYMRSLLQIEVPVVVTLAAKQDSVASILELGLGTILQFDKGCEETLDLEVAGCRVAEGEPVKVGDKFGLRLTAISLPEERFQTVGKRGSP